MTNCRSHAEQTGSCTFLWSVVWTSQWSRRGLELDGAFLCVISTLIERNQTTIRRTEKKEERKKLKKTIIRQLLQSLRLSQCRIPRIGGGLT